MKPDGPELHIISSIHVYGTAVTLKKYAKTNSRRKISVDIRIYFLQCRRVGVAKVCGSSACCTCSAHTSCCSCSPSSRATTASVSPRCFRSFSSRGRSAPECTSWSVLLTDASAYRTLSAYRFRIDHSTIAKLTLALTLKSTPLTLALDPTGSVQVFWRR